VLVTDSPSRPRLPPFLRLWAKFIFWNLVGLLSPTPRFYWLSYGGRRLAKHPRRENELAGLLKVALEGGRNTATQAKSLDLSWDIDTLKRNQKSIVGRELSGRGRMTWLWGSSPERVHKR
jgi:hypothetical protein